MLRTLFLLVPLLLLVHVSSAVALPPCPTDPTAYWDNCEGVYTYPEGDKYVGEWKDDKYHGHGTFTWSRNAEEYVAGLPAAGSEYVGQWRDDTFDGYGTMFWANGEVWVGQFREWDMSSGNKYTAGNVPPEVYYYSENCKCA